MNDFVFLPSNKQIIMFIRYKLGFLLTIVSLVLSVFQTSFAAELEGMWTAEHPVLGGLFFRVKSDGSCTYFLEKGTETTIHKGTWEEIPSGLGLTFENGVYFSIGQLEPGVADLRMDMSSGHDVEPGVVVSQAGLVNSKSIGRMTVEARQEEEEEKRHGFFGAWEGELVSGKKIYFIINDDRTAGMTHSFTSPDASEEYQDIVGFWKKDGEKLQIIWNDGSFTLFETNGRRIEQTSFVAGDLLESAKGTTSRVLPIRTKDLPEEWHKEFKKDYVTRMPIIVLRKPALLKSFFRGEWVVGADPEKGEFRSIQLKRFGNAYTNRYGGVKGDWFPNADSVAIVWRNGVRERMSVVGNQFIVNSFNPDQPSSGRPAKIEPINAVDPDKMGYYVNRKSELLDPDRILKRFKKALGKDKKKKDDSETENDDADSESSE